jgi:hypothetical protein
MGCSRHNREPIVWQEISKVWRVAVTYIHSPSRHSQSEETIVSIEWPCAVVRTKCAQPTVKGRGWLAMAGTCRLIRNPKIAPNSTPTIRFDIHMNSDQITVVAHMSPSLLEQCRPTPYQRYFATPRILLFYWTNSNPGLCNRY